MPFFSIIVPVYKVEKYLQQCVLSILHQDFSDYELLLVNDGSPDRCPAICDEFSEKDKRIRTIHKENGGLSDARNVGVAFASGDYIIFLDSDDFWEDANSLSALHKQILSTEADAVIFGVVDFYESKNKRVVSRGNFPTLNGFDSKAYAFDCLLHTNNFPGSAWMFSVKRSLLINHSIFFEKGIKAEDIDWIINVLIHSKTFSVLNKIVYVYRKNRQGSITNTSDHKNIEGILFAIEKWKNNLESNLLEESYALLHYLASQYFTAFVSFATLDSSQKKELMPRMKKVQSIAQYDRSLRGKVARVCLKVLGVNGFANLVYRIYSRNSTK